MAKIRFPTRIAQATDEGGPSRYALQGTLVTPEGFAVATDGRIAACVKVKMDGLDALAMVPQELGPSSKTDLKAEYHANGELRCEKHSIVKGQQRVEQAEIRDDRFPRVGDIVKGIDVSKRLVMGINANYLLRLAQAINVPDTGDVVVLLIPTPKEGDMVTEVIGVLSNLESSHDANGFGILMPCDAEVAQARKDFKKLSTAAVTSLDAGAKAWSERSVADSKDEKAKATESPTNPSIPLKPTRKPRRKQAVA